MRDSTLTDKAGTSGGRPPVSAQGLCVQALKGWWGFCNLAISTGTPAGVSLRRDLCHGPLKPTASFHLRKKDVFERDRASLDEPAAQPVLPHIHPASCMLPSEPILSCWTVVSMFSPNSLGSSIHLWHPMCQCNGGTRWPCPHPNTPREFFIPIS